MRYTYEDWLRDNEPKKNGNFSPVLIDQFSAVEKKVVEPVEVIAIDTPTEKPLKVAFENMEEMTETTPEVIATIEEEKVKEEPKPLKPRSRNHNKK